MIVCLLELRKPHHSRNKVDGLTSGAVKGGPSSRSSPDPHQRIRAVPRCDNAADHYGGLKRCFTERAPQDFSRPSDVGVCPRDLNGSKRPGPARQGPHVLVVGRGDEDSGPSFASKSPSHFKPAAGFKSVRARRSNRHTRTTGTGPSGIDFVDGISYTGAFFLACFRTCPRTGRPPTPTKHSTKSEQRW